MVEFLPFVHFINAISCDKDRNTALIVACDKKMPEVALIILERVDINIDCHSRKSIVNHSLL